jgi:uracil-DNA glycosylase
MKIGSDEDSLSELLSQIRACKICEEHLPFPPKPILIAKPGAVLLIVGQAPGLRVHETGLPWNDPSGDRLRKWLRMTRTQFYNDDFIAIIPTGFCYPGKGNRGDLPPRPECAPQWHPLLRKLLKNIKLTLLIGSHAQRYYLRNHMCSSLAETVRNWQAYLPDFIPLPHPSPRNIAWFKKNQWFENEVLPNIRCHVWRILNQAGMNF